MKRMKRQSVWRSRAYVLSVLVFAASLIASLAPSIAAFAAGSIFAVKSAEITEISTNATGTITGFDDSTIVSEVTFHKLGDSATYKVTLQNTGSEDHTIKTISDDNSNANVSYSYEKHENETITAGSNLEFVFTAKYATAVTNTSKRAQSSNVKFSIEFADIEETADIVVSPNTNDDLGVNMIVLAISATGLIVCVVIYIKNHKKSAKVLGIAIALVATTAIAASVNAASTSSNSFTLTTNYGFYDKLIIHYGDNDILIDYGDRLKDVNEIDAPGETGQTFGGWTDEEGNDIDPSKPITEDITIVAKLTNNTYTINFDANDDAATGSMESLSAVYGTPVTLTANNFAKTNYAFAGWATAPTGDVVYEDGAEVTNLVEENGGSITLYAKWEKLSLTVNMLGNGRKIGGADKNVIKINGECDSNGTRIRTKYSHTPNVNDAGEADGDYEDNLKLREYVTIRGAKKLRIKMHYRVDSDTDVIYVYKGTNREEIYTYMYDYEKKYRYGGGDETFDIDGDTATFIFISGSKYHYYGYYATIDGIDAQGNIMNYTSPVCDRDYVSGDYAEPDSGNYQFDGWSENPNAAFGDYFDEAELLTYLPGAAGETKTVYAIWTQLYDVNYAGNGSTMGSMSDTKQEGYIPGDELVLIAPNFLREGYGYVGWSTDKNAQPGGSSVIYGPNQIMTLNDELKNAAKDDGQITLHAIWIPENTTYTLQTFNKETFELTNPGTRFTALRDTRDGQTYAVSKLASGDWWMIENLRFDPAGKTLDETNTNNPTASFATAAKNKSSSVLDLCDDDTAGCVNKYSVGVTNMTAQTASPFDDNARWYAYGVLYNWYSATAGNGTFAMGNYADTNGDICPAGWQLPATNTGGTHTNAEFTRLDVALGGTGFPLSQYHIPTSNPFPVETSYPNNFVFSGLSIYNGRDNGEVMRRGTFGRYHGRTSGRNEYDSDIGYYDVYWESIKGSSVGVSGVTKHEGYTVRCVAK